MAQLFTQGDVAITSWTSDRAQAAIDGGAPLGWTIPEEGAYIIDLTIGIAKGTKKLELAQRYINFVLSDEAQVANARHTYLTPTNGRVQLPPDLAAKLPAADLPKLKGADWDYVTKVRPQWTQRWAGDRHPLTLFASLSAPATDRGDVLDLTEPAPTSECSQTLKRSASKGPLLMKINFETRTVLVTGAAQGIGRAIGRAFLNAGARVHVADIDETGVRHSAAELGATAHVADLSDKAAAGRVVAEIIDIEKRLDILALAAGGVRGQVGSQLNPSRSHNGMRCSEPMWTARSS